MKKIIPIVALLLIPTAAAAQERTPISFELEEEKLEIEADIPSVDLFLSFRELQERNRVLKESFIDEIVDSAKKDPF